MKEYITLHLNKLKEDNGFTLIELLTVMAIIGILVVIGSDMYMNYRAKAYDAAAISDGRQLLNAVMNSIVSSDDVDYAHAENGGNRVGATDTSGSPRAPILFLSPSTRLRIDGPSNTPGDIFIEAHLYSVGGTKDSSPSGRREFYCIVDEANGLSSFSIE
ncbi:type IV pilin protein [Desulfobacterium sp. N47]|uniref:Prepilin-type N-terminal cleavage/methylation domain-containing protein n=1 Tax=uncultured Desulfobacterium sp. TaxID=201089 RepID=E1Y8W1_9BACT|nr:hypothetical protein N47_A10340 [uncultured Desulfobacterium sp.]